MPSGKPVLERRSRKPGFVPSFPPLRAIAAKIAPAPAYQLRVPLARGHWISVISNRPMTDEAWRRFWRYLALQREIFVEEAASCDTLPEGQDAKQGLAGTEGSAVGEAETPKHSPKHIGDILA